ncbi:oligogalacturonate lyase family protein [Jeotgalibacillus soli]|uniref:Oligogalacturonate lyase domain-containing protein n=1 Tax=Jeotgalibacillus soli TaxID=889306 RepID=A0A0C2W7X5_9BACL|nr:oligogalacturonate lyase family protein [Jeotgalibacillus soli]KIL52123.1 hypothetical protein KP78_04930 [Jeotgalibacillus soli]
MIGKRYPSEKRMYLDQKTGKQVWQLTSVENNFHFYFTDNSFSLGDQEIYFLSDRSSHHPEHYNLFKMDLGTGEMTQLTDEEKGIAPGLHTKTPDSELVVYVTGNQIKTLDTKTLRSKIIYEENNHVHLGHPHIAPNKKYIGIARNEKVDVPRGANYKGFTETMYAVKKSWISLIHLDGTKKYDVFMDTHWLGHFQFSPKDSTAAIFCHEGPWNLVQQRIWLLDITSRSVEPLFRQGEDDCIGHEFWTEDEKIFFDNRRKGHDGTITINKTQVAEVPHDSDQTPFIGLADKQGHNITTIPLPFYCNHYHSNKDNTLLVGDGVEDLVLIDLSGEEAVMETLCSHETSWNTQQTHCHPTFSWDNRYILFTSDREGTCNLYLVDLDQNDLN